MIQSCMDSRRPRGPHSAVQHCEDLRTELLMFKTEQRLCKDRGVRDGAPGAGGWGGGGENTGCRQPAKLGVTSQTPCRESGKHEC